MVKQRTIWLVVLIWVMAASSAHAVGLEAAAGGWYQDISGDASYRADDIFDFLEVDDDLNYDSETRLHGRVKIDMPLFLPNIYLMAAPSEFEGTGLKNVDFDFGDFEFAGNVPFFSKLTINQYDVALYYGLPFLRTATLNTLNIDIGINVRIVDVEAEVRQSATGLSETQDATVPVPLVYIGVQLTPLDWLAIEAEGRGMTISGNSVYSLIGRIRLDIFGPVFVAAGYRYDKVDVDEDDVDVDLDLKGPFAEVGLRF
ncbi:MAG: TIGR04219 family outer membrane beta-barrel protein [Desulfobacteraceae bacterium]|nr:MAG: TIGR04219 family outer membrane beta-barrel protein [Desulfobacteraceae bacterium]